MTKKQLLENYEKWKKSTATELWDIYSNYSYNKEKALNMCYRIMKNLNGFNLKIVGYNSNVFTVGFMTIDNGKQIYHHITPTNHYQIQVN